MPPTSLCIADIQSGAWRALVRLWPIILLVGYLTGTVFLFAFGPIPWPITNPWATYGFLAVAHLALLGGYLAVPFRIPEGRPPERLAWLFAPAKLLAVSAALNITLLLPATLFMTRGSLDLFGALREPSVAYANAYRMSVDTTNPWSYALLLTAPLLTLLIPLTFFYWRELPLGLRCLAITAIAVHWASGAILGRYKTTADLILLGFVFVLVWTFRRRQPPPGRRSALVVVVAIIAAVLFVALFGSIVVNRAHSADRGHVGFIDVYLDDDNLLLRPFPQAAQPTIGLLHRYLTQGYYGLSLALRLDFVWTRGLGNSFFLHLVEERFLGTEFARTNAYPARIEQAFGYRMLARWHSIYPWLASDLTFFGTILFVALVGILLALTWFEMLNGVNPFSVSMFANLCLMLFYFNANNQVLGFPIQFSATVGTTVLWIYTRRRLQRGGKAASAASPA